MTTNVGSIEYDARINTKNFAQDASNVERRASQVASSVHQSGSAGFKAFASEASSSFNGIANSIAGLAKVVAGLFIGGAFGIGTFVKQASELQSIRASFESMTGSAEEATKVLGQLNKFSFETAFKTSEINAAARTFLGAGLAVGDLGKTLKGVGDVAGATGADLGQLTLPLSQALSRGKLQTQDYYQILNSGAGKLGQALRQELAERGMGDFSKAMEEGKVTSEILFATIEKSAAKGGFAFEGALKQSKTFAGQMSNLQEMIGNVALEILGVNKATGQVDPNGLFAKMSKAVQDATKWLTENKDVLKGWAESIINNAVPVLGALTTAFIGAKVAAIAFSIAASANPIGLIAAAIVALIAGLTFLQIKFNIFGKAFEAMKPVIQPVVKAFKDMWSLMMKKLAPAFEFVSRNAEVFKKIALVLIATTLTPIIVSFTALVGIVFAVIGIVIALAEAFKFLYNGFFSVYHFMKDQLTSLWQTVSSVFTSIANVIRDTMNAIWGVIRPVLNFILDLYTIVWGSIAIVVILAVQKIWQIVSTVFNAVKDVITNTLNAILSVVSGVWNAIYGVMTGVLGSIINFFAPAASWLYDKGTAIVHGLVNGIRAIAGSVWGAIKSVADPIGQFFSGAGSWLYETGKAIIQGMINGIKDMGGRLLNVVGDSANAVKNKFKDVLGIHSPSRVFAEYGKNIVQGLTVGVQKNEGMATDAVGSMLGSTGMTPPTANFGLDAIEASKSNGNSSNATININMQGVMTRSKSDEREVARSLITRLNEELSSKGVQVIGGGAL